jgi:hypothetical protein
VENWRLEAFLDFFLKTRGLNAKYAKGLNPRLIWKKGRGLNEKWQGIMISRIYFPMRKYVDSVHNVVDRGRLSVHGSTVDWDNGGGGGSSGCGLSDMGAH